MLEKLFRNCERLVIVTLLFLMMVVVLISSGELAWIIFKSLCDTTNNLLLTTGEMLSVFSFFLLILIGIELLETIKMYLDDRKVHVEVVLLVALIAVARKAIVLDYQKYSALTILGMAGLLLALAGGYFLVKRADHNEPPKP